MKKLIISTILIVILILCLTSCVSLSPMDWSNYSADTLGINYLTIKDKASGKIITYTRSDLSGKWCESAIIRTFYTYITGHSSSQSRKYYSGVGSNGYWGTVTYDSYWFKTKGGTSIRMFFESGELVSWDYY